MEDMISEKNDNPFTNTTNTGISDRLASKDQQTIGKRVKSSSTSSADSVFCENSHERKLIKKRKISFLADSVLCAVIQDGDMQELFRILHDPCGDVNVNSENHVGLTALHHAVLNNNLDAVKMLLSCGSNVNAQDVHGFSPLHTSAACGFLHISSLLIVFGADVFLMTKQLELAADLAKDFSVIRMLNNEMYFQVNKESSKNKIDFQHILTHTWHVLVKCLRFILTFLWAVLQSVVSFLMSRCQKQSGLCSRNKTIVPDKNQNSDVVNDAQQKAFAKQKRRSKPLKLE